MKLSGWGRYPVVDCRLEHYRGDSDLRGLIDRSPTLIARGNGRAYGDAAVNPELTVSMLGAGRILAFDAETGLLTCEAGALLDDILQACVPRGWFPPVVPGTRFVTVGGLIAADVHGKNHHRDGTFGAHVESLILATADGELRECSRDTHAELLRATIGGMGLTGVILSATFRLQRMDTAYVTQEVLPVADLDAAMALFEESRDWPYSVAWIDALARGRSLGRGLVLRGRPLERGALPPRLARNPRHVANRGPLTVPFEAPTTLLNRLSIGVFNALYSGLGRARGAPRPVHYAPFFFPLDGLGAWNRLYGRKGFVQYQCVLPRRESRGIGALLARVAAARPGCALAVLKLLGPRRAGMLSFPMEGYTLALDFPLRDGTLELLDALDAITHEHGGRVYLAKDACSAPERVRSGYPEWDAFLAVRAETAGAAPRFASGLSRRLAL